MRTSCDEAVVSIQGLCSEGRGNCRGAAETNRPAAAAVRWAWRPIKFRGLTHVGINFAARMKFLRALGAVLFVFWVGLTRSNAASTIYEVWRNATNDSSTATRIADSVSSMAFDDSSAPAGVASYYWIKMRTVETSHVYTSINFWFADHRVFAAHLTCPTKAKRGVASELTTTIDFSSDIPTVVGGGNLTIRWVDVDLVKNDNLVTPYVANDIWWTGGTNRKTWETAAILSDFEPSFESEVELQLQVQVDDSSGTGEVLPPNDFAKTPLFAVQLVDSYDPAPTGVTATAQSGFVRVTWSASSGLSSFSAPASATMSAGLPSPTAVTATKGTYSSFVRVTWNGVTDATNYDLFRSTTNNSSGAALSYSAGSGVTSFDDAAAVAGTTYYYWVKARQVMNGNLIATSGFSASDSGYRGAGS